MGDLNVPVVDGQTLHDIIITNGYTRALEIGPSTGHSSIWFACALAKTGGKLVTIEIDERQRQALANFEAAGAGEAAATSTWITCSAFPTWRLPSTPAAPG